MKKASNLFITIIVFYCFNIAVLYPQVNNCKLLTLNLYGLRSAEDVNKIQETFLKKESIYECIVNYETKTLKIKYAENYTISEIEKIIYELGFKLDVISEELIVNAPSENTKTINKISGLNEVISSDELNEEKQRAKEFYDNSDDPEQKTIKEKLNRLESLRKNAIDKDESTENYDRQIQELIKDIE